MGKTGIDHVSGVYHIQVWGGGTGKVATDVERLEIKRKFTIRTDWTVPSEEYRVTPNTETIRGDGIISSN